MGKTVLLLRKIINHNNINFDNKITNKNTIPSIIIIQIILTKNTKIFKSWKFRSFEGAHPHSLAKKIFPNSQIFNNYYNSYVQPIPNYHNIVKKIQIKF